MSSMRWVLLQLIEFLIENSVWPDDDDNDNDADNDSHSNAYDNDDSDSQLEK